MVFFPGSVIVYRAGWPLELGTTWICSGGSRVCTVSGTSTPPVASCTSIDTFHRPYIESTVPLPTQRDPLCFKGTVGCPISGCAGRLNERGTLLAFTGRPV